MVFEILGELYKCGCERGVADYKEEGILRRLNALAEWDKCRFPKNIQRKETLVYGQEGKSAEIVLFEENRDFLGPNPTLQPGNMIKVGEMIIAIDSPNRLVLSLGKKEGSFKRFLEEVYREELRFIFKERYLPDFDLTWEELEFDDPSYDIPVSLDFPEYNLWIQEFVKGRRLQRTDEGNLMIHCITTTSCFGQQDLVMGERCAYFKSSGIFDPESDQDMMKDIMRSTITWFLLHFDRASDPLPLDPIGTPDMQREYYRISFEEKEKRES